MKVTVAAGAEPSGNVSLLAIPCFEGKNGPEVDRAWKKLFKSDVEAVLSSGDFAAKTDRHHTLYPTGRGGPDRILLVGLGDKAALDGEALRRYGGTVAQAASEREGSKAVALLPSARDVNDAVARVAEGLTLGSYRFHEYRDELAKAQKKKIAAVQVQLPAGTSLPPARKALNAGLDIGYGVNLCRDLGNAPGNALGPAELATRARAEAKKAGLKCTVLGDKELEKEGMGALLGVAQGSARPGRLIVLDYTPSGKSRGAPIVFVGKAITFDSGGISIKPAEGMQDMKFDMCGGGAVVGAMAAIGRLKPKQRVIGLIAAAENMPSGTAIRPGDILRSAAGLSIEIINTDAEGRLVLADALHYAKRYKPRLVLDLATLTGACVVALGMVNTGVFSQDEDLSHTLCAEASKVGERFWPLPLQEPYFDLIRSDVADVKNSGGRWGGAITAAAFLAKFIDGVPWAHLDVAGTAWSERSVSYEVKGASGAGVRTLVHLAESY